MFAAALIILLAGTSVFVAEGALPGDVLYTIKTGINGKRRDAR